MNLGFGPTRKRFGIEPSHLRGQLQGPSVTIPFSSGALLLGTWQQIVLVDFDTRARTRELIVQVLGE
jgi:thiamine phosphate synthase YjbQ (UPF0047 family)